MEVVVKTARLSKLTIVVIVSFVFVQERKLCKFLLQRGRKLARYFRRAVGNGWTNGGESPSDFGRIGSKTFSLITLVFYQIEP